MNFFDEIKLQFQKGSLLIKLILINVGVYVIVNLVHLILFFAGAESAFIDFIYFLAVPSNVSELLFKPWTIVTYMFLHEDFMHILFNMLVLFWMGRIFTMYLNERQLLTVYLFGGISGAAFYILVFNIAPVFAGMASISYALGASASVMAVAIAISIHQPRFPINLLFIGQVELRWVGICIVFLDIISITKNNPGGHLAHLGGAIFGFLYIQQLKKGNDISKGTGRFFDWVGNIFKPKPKMHISYKNPKGKPLDDMEFNQMKHQRQAKLDNILEKIKRSGYDALTKEEKDFLFKESQK